jgi:predicted Fe-Mo cluster-binding NifX family protein
MYTAIENSGEDHVKIAVPTNDGLSISEHFGRSAGFLIFETGNAQITSREMRSNQGVHAHGEAGCGGEHAGHNEPHSHAAILSSIAGCDVVICAGMGWRAAEALKQAGVREVIMTEPGPAEEKVQAYLRGEMPAAGPGFCRCSH